MSALASLLLVLVLPAIAGGLLLAGPTRDEAASIDQETSLDVKIARGLACGIGVWLLGSGLLARTVDLTDTSAWIWDAVVALVSLAVLALPRSRARLRAAVAPVGRRLAECVGLTTVVFVPLAYVIVHTSWSPLGSTPWYYYGLARQVADAGVVPASSIEFATTTTFLNDYHLFTTGTAMLLVQHPSDPITVITIVALLSVLLLGIGAMTFATALGAGRVASLVAVSLAVGTGIGPIRLAAYRPEGLALGLCLLLTALSIDWLRRRDWRSLVAAAVLAATLSQVHGIAALTSGVLIASAAVVSLIRGQRKEQLRRTGIALVALLSAVVVTGLVFREASGTAHAGGLVDRGGLADPTWEFFMAARGEPSSMPQSNAEMVVDSIRSLYERSWWWFIPLLILAVVGLVRRRRDADARRIAAFTLVALVGLAAIASVFMFAWQGYVPRRTGASRIVLEASLLMPTFVAIGLQCLVRDMAGWRRTILSTEKARMAALLAAATALGAFSMIGLAGYDSDQAPTRDELAVWESLPLTSSDIVLANAYTEGFIPDVTPAQGLLDGRAPYTFGDLLARANGLFRGAQSFFDDPATHWGYLADNNVTWVVVGDPDTYSLSTGNVWDTPPNLTALDNCGGLEQVVHTDTLTVYRVTDSGPDGCSTAPAG
ncbi:MAG TPA: hypothetical protein VLK34_07925 [Nocardioidaceae bacterium]|nr:hypothetical protein [Nocardioidaceae bacterium]